MEDDKKLLEKLDVLLPILNEQQKRIFLAAESIFLGRGGKTRIEKLAGVSHNTINKGIKEIMLVVEIKGDIEMDAQVARAKEQAGKEHFDTLTKRLLRENPINVDEELRNSLRQHYEFFLLHPEDYQRWFRNLKTGNIISE